MDQLFPNYVEATTKKDLRSKMAVVSMSRGGTVNFYATYFDPITKTHVAWYHDKAENIMAQEYNSLKDNTDAIRAKK